jgi:hypothetical protein
MQDEYVENNFHQILSEAFAEEKERESQQIFNKEIEQYFIEQSMFKYISN